MRTLKTLSLLGILAMSGVALAPSEAQAQLWRRNVSYYYNPGPYYYPAPVTYYYPTAVYSYYQPVPVIPSYGYATQAVYQWPGYAPVYGGAYYRGIGPYYNTGYYYFRGRW